jgi:protein-L-isoaspartate(D-aspartate) O-methyltransferase
MAEMNFDQARQTMVEQQIRTWDVLDPQVLELIGRTPREDYVPEQYRKLAFVDMAIPLGYGQVMMQPKIEARLLQTLTVRPGDHILEIGTGSGYMAALLAGLGKHVTSVEIIPELLQQAKKKLAERGVDNVTLESGDGAGGWASHAPYDGIMITGSLPLLPEAFANSLNIGGRMVVIVGKAPTMEACLIRRLDQTHWQTTSLFETDLPPLINAKEPDRFVF